MMLRKRHRIAEGRALENESAVVSSNGCQKFRDGFVVPDFSHLNRACDGVTGPNGSAEVPVNMQEYRTRAGQVLSNDCVQNGAGDSSLNYDSAETCRLCHLLVIV